MKTLGMLILGIDIYKDTISNLTIYEDWHAWLEAAVIGFELKGSTLQNLHMSF